MKLEIAWTGGRNDWRRGLRPASSFVGFRERNGDGRPGGATCHACHRKAGLTRLQTDHIDLHHIHATDNVAPIEETPRTLDDLVRPGKVRYVRASNWQAWRIMKLGISERAGLVRCDGRRPITASPARDLEREIVAAVH